MVFRVHSYLRQHVVRIVPRRQPATTIGGLRTKQMSLARIDNQRSCLPAVGGCSSCKLQMATECVGEFHLAGTRHSDSNSLGLETRMQAQRRRRVTLSPPYRNVEGLFTRPLSVSPANAYENWTPIDFRDVPGTCPGLNSALDKPQSMTYGTTGDRI